MRQGHLFYLINTKGICFLFLFFVFAKNLTWKIPNKIKLIEIRYIIVILFAFHPTFYFCQNFEITEIDKKSANLHINKFTDIASTTEGSLIYRTDRGTLIQDYGNFQKTIDIPSLLNKSELFEDWKNDFNEEQIEVYENNKVYFSKKQSLFSLDLKTGKIELLFKNKDNKFKFYVNHKGIVWVLTKHGNVYEIPNSSIINTFKIDFSNSNQLHVFLTQDHFKIYKTCGSHYLTFNKEVFKLNKGSKKFELFQSFESQSKELPVILYCNDSGSGKKIDPAISTVKGIDFVNVKSKNFIVNGRYVNLIAWDKNTLRFYKLNENQEEQSKYSLISELKLNLDIRKITYSNNIIFIVDALNKIYRLKNKENGFLKYMFNPRASTRGIVMDSKKNVFAIKDKALGEVVRVDSLGKEEIILKEGTTTFSNPKNDKKIPIKFWGMTIEKDSLLWLQGVNFPLVKHNLHTSKTELFSFPNEIRDHFIQFKYEIRNNTWEKYDENSLLFVTPKSLVLFDKKRGTYRELVSHDLKIFASALVYKKGKIWIGTYKRGLFVYDEKKRTISNYRKEIGELKLSSNVILDLHIDKEDKLWVGTSKGLDILDFKEFKVKRFSIENGLPDNRVVSIEESNESFWLGTFNGLVRMDKRSNTIYNFFRKDGISENEFNRSSSYRHDDRGLVFGGMNGYVRIDPKKVRDHFMPSVLRLINLKIFDISKKRVIDQKFNLDQTQNIRIGYQHNFLSLTFSDLTSNAILYKIDDSDWVQSNNGKIDLIGLKYGNRILLVKSNFSGAEPLKYSIYVTKPFYMHIWVQWLIFVIISIIIAIIFINKRKQQKVSEIRNQKIKNMEDEALRYQMNPHFLFNVLNNLQSIFFLEGKLKANQYFTELSKMLRFTVDVSGSKEIKLVDEIEYLKSYLKLEQLRENDEFQFEINISDNVEVQKIKIPPMMLQPIVENAIKHGFSGLVQEALVIIAFSMDEDTLVIRIIDNGVGICDTYFKKNLQNKNSFGLQALKRRIQLYNETQYKQIIFDISKGENGKGTIAIIKIKNLT